MTDLNITIGEPIEALLTRAAAADRLAASGAALQDPPTYVDFADWEQFARVMTSDLRAEHPFLREPSTFARPES